MLIVLTAMVMSIELILAACALLSHVPIVVDQAFVHTIIQGPPPKQQRDLFLYGLWITLGTGLFLVLRWIVTSAQKKHPVNLKFFLSVHALLAFLMGHAGFEIIAMGDPIWAWPMFWGSFTAAVGVSIFWPEFLLAASSFKKCYSSLRLKPWVAPLLGCLVIFLVVFMPDLQAVVALVYMGEYYHNWDVMLFGGVYAISKGLVPCVDVITTYAFGVAVIVAKLVNLMGGFSYARVLGIMMWVGITYYILWFLLVRRLFVSSLLALATVLFAIRMQMFNLMTEPFTFAEPMATVFRYCFDIGIFWMLWMHIQTRRIIFLAVGGLFASLGLYYMWTTGMYMFFVFALYVIAAALIPCLGGGMDRLRWRNHALVLAGAVALTSLWFFLTEGAHIFEPRFWQNMVEYNGFFVKGVFSDALTSPILAHNYVLGIGGLLVPVFYLATFLYNAGKVMEGKIDKKDIFIGLLAFYAVEVHSYYMVRASQWYTIGLPGTILFFYWLTKILARLPVHWQKRIAWGLLAAACWCLMTDRLFTGYPNLLNFSRNPIVDSRTFLRVGPRLVPYFHQLFADFPESFKLPLNSLGEKDEQLKYEGDFASDEELKNYFNAQMALPEDTALIRRLTSKDDRVPVISSFEITLLNNADRKPFFYYFPLINNRPLTVRNFMVTGLITYTQLQKVLDQLDTEKPPYIFMERIFLTPQVPQGYFYQFPDLIYILRYVLANYEPQETGKYLVAMKRK